LSSELSTDHPLGNINVSPEQAFQWFCCLLTRPDQALLHLQLGRVITVFARAVINPQHLRPIRRRDLREENAGALGFYLQHRRLSILRFFISLTCDDYISLVQELLGHQALWYFFPHRLRITMVIMSASRINGSTCGW